MNLVEFQELSKRTMPYNGDPQTLRDFKKMLTNYSMGLIGELMELSHVFILDDYEACKKEIGDVFHYAVGLLLCIGEKLDYELLRATEWTEHDGAKAMSDILEIPKKYIYHGHKMEYEKFKKAIYNILKCFVSQFTDVTLSEILEMNIEKLKIRYPNGFNSKDSKKRMDVKQG